MTAIAVIVICVFGCLNIYLVKWLIDTRRMSKALEAALKDYFLG
ncbi:MAG: hypothetical protein ABIT05_01185 [Chitinophagaceae bacterium]